MKPANYGVISEAEQQHLKTSSHIRAKLKSDQQVLEMYKNIVGDVQENDSLLKVWQKQIETQNNYQKNSEPNQTDKIRSKPNLSLRKIQKSSPLKRTDKSFQVPYINPSSIRMPAKNTTNYSQGYRQSKPFSNKQGRTATVYVQDPPSIPPSPSILAKIPYAQQQFKRLSYNSNIVKPFQKHEIGSKISRTVQHMKNQQKRLRDQIKRINQQQIQLQQSLKQYHLQYKQYCRDIQQKHDINYNISQIKSTKQILTLDQNNKQFTKSKRTQIIQEYKVFTDRIQHEIRKIDYLVEEKKENIQKEQMQNENSRLYALLQQPIEREQKDDSITERPILEGPTYKQIMKARKTKNFTKLQQLIVQTPKQDQEDNEQLLNEISSIQKNQTKVYENEHGQLKVNQNLRDLLLK